MGRSYTWGSPEGVQAVITEVEGMLIPYAMTLNVGDMEALIRALAWTDETNPCESEDPDHRANGGDCPDTCWRWRASSLLSDIAESMHVDWV